MHARACPARPWAGPWSLRCRGPRTPSWGSGPEVSPVPETGCLAGGRLLHRWVCSASMLLESSLRLRPPWRSALGPASPVS
eukprot:986583-Pyramimonas_sp.AAC.1